MRVKVHRLRKIILESLLSEAEGDTPDPGADAATGPLGDLTPNMPYQEQEGDSFDSKLDAAFVKAEKTEDEGVQSEVFLKNLVAKLLTEAGEDEQGVEGGGEEASGGGGEGGEEQPNPADAPSKTKSPLNVDRFASEIVRLIDHFDDLFDVPGTVMKRAMNYVGKNYDASTVRKLQSILEQNFNLTLDKKDPQYADENQPPPAAGAGPSGGG